MGVAFGHDAEPHNQLLIGIELSNQLAACRGRLIWVLKSQLPLVAVDRQGG